MHADPKTLRVINLYAGPGAGKSTTAAGLFFEMKHMGLRVELVTEYAKDLTYREDSSTLSNQLYILGKQDARLRRLVGKVDFAITDSPLPLGLLYATEEYGAWYREAVLGAYQRYDNASFFISRSKPYATFGRSQTEDEAVLLDWAVKATVGELTQVVGDRSAPSTILGLLGLLDAR